MSDSWIVGTPLFCLESRRHAWTLVGGKLLLNISISDPLEILTSHGETVIVSCQSGFIKCSLITVWISGVRNEVATNVMTLIG